MRTIRSPFRDDSHLLARAILVFCLLQLGTGCYHRAPGNSAHVDTTATKQMGPRVVSLRPPGVEEYYVEVKPEFDHVVYAGILAARVGGKVGYIYQNFHAFTIHSIPETAVEKLRRMPEVLSVTKSTLGKMA